DGRQPGPHRLYALAQSSKPMARTDPQRMAGILAGDDPDIESEAVERPRQTAEQQPSEYCSDRKQRAAGNRNGGYRGLAEHNRKGDETGGKQRDEAEEQSAADR